MKWLHNMKIKAKMLLGFFVVIALMIALATFAVFQMNKVSGLSTYAAYNAGAKKDAMLEIRRNTLNLRRVLATITMYIPLNDTDRIYPLITEGNENFKTSLAELDKYENLVRIDPKFTQAEFNQQMGKIREIRQALDGYKREIFDVIADSALKGDFDAAVQSTIDGSDTIGGMWNSVTELAESAAASEAVATNSVTVMTIRSEILIIIIAAVAAIIAAVIALYMAAMISKPLIKLSAFMKKAGATGNLTLSSEETDTFNKLGKYKDEIGSTISGATSFVDHVTIIDHEMKAVANGDLTGEIALKSEEDTMGLSLKKMVDNLNEMFEDIHVSTSQVSSGTRQIANGAQALAQGATEQAISIEELSGSITEIAAKTEENAKTAGKASGLSAEIKETAEKGSRHMNEMIGAVKDISDASQTINKIIKTIDDIAFQTNILALNAAVEAARAGQHGKGFAVVAEEVRNLASKSAEAAKNTGNVIQDSIEKTQLGSQIAGATAASLNEIVIGINESARLIDEITHASEQQSRRVKQIKVGMDQVAQVVQQNSATAEESAAASEEMSGQSDMLEQLVAQFKLKESGQIHQCLDTQGSSKHRLLDIPNNVEFSTVNERW